MRVPTAGLRSRRTRKNATHAFEVGGGVHAGAGGGIGHMHGNAVAVPQRTQLLQRFQCFDGRRRQLRKLPQKAGAVAVDADVAQRGGAGQGLEMGIALGIALGLIVDEAALLITLDDVYWQSDGWPSIAIAVSIIGVVGTGLALTRSGAEKPRG